MVSVKGRTVNENGTIRYYDANSGELARKLTAEIEPGVGLTSIMICSRKGSQNNG